MDTLCARVVNCAWWLLTSLRLRKAYIQMTLFAHNHYAAVVNIYTWEGGKKTQTYLIRLNLEGREGMSFCINNVMISTTLALIFRCVNADDNRKECRRMGLCLLTYWNKHYWIVIQFWQGLQIPYSRSISCYNFPFKQRLEHTRKSEYPMHTSRDTHALTHTAS